jgi:ABC-type transporter Mla subunit MlaD
VTDHERDEYELRRTRAVADELAARVDALEERVRELEQKNAWLTHERDEAREAADEAARLMSQAHRRLGTLEGALPGATAALLRVRAAFRLPEPVAAEVGQVIEALRHLGDDVAPPSPAPAAAPLHPA